MYKRQPKKQTELIGNLSDLVTNYLARPGMGLEAALARFDEEIDVYKRQLAPVV